MRTSRRVSAVGTAALLVGLLASGAAAQDRGRQGAPFVRVYSQNGAGVASSYVTPAVEVSEDAYVFVVSMDLDGQIQILHPDFPGISVRIRERQQLRLPNFFAGFSQSSDGGVYSPARYPGYQSYDENDSRGTVIALASREPFNLERVESDGDWNISAIRSLIEYRTPQSAAQALASYLGAKGEPIGRDYMRFASARHYNYAADALYSCDLYYGGFTSSLGFGRLAVLDRVARLKQAGRSVRIVGYDFCGMPIVAYGPSRTATGFRPPTPRNNPADTSAAGRRLTHSIPRSAPQAGNVPRSAALGYFPITTRSEPQHSGDGIVTEPNERRRDPRQIPLDRRIDPRGGGLSGTTGIPLERTAPRRTETPVIGVEPPRQYSRPTPRESPPPRSEPPRGPDRSSPPPAPVAHERPSSPPPPPPVAHEQQSQPAPAPPRAQSGPRSTPSPVPPPQH